MDLEWLIVIIIIAIVLPFKFKMMKKFFQKSKLKGEKGNPNYIDE